MATLPVETTISTVLPTATIWPGAGLVVITLPAGTVELLAVVVDGAPTSPVCRRMSRAAASVWPGRLSGTFTALGPSEILRITSALGSTDVPAAGSVPMAVPAAMVSCLVRWLFGRSLAP